MRRLSIVERGDWRAQAAACGFRFHTPNGQRYWDERAYYAFSLRQIEDDLEAVTEELHQMALALVTRIVRDEQLLQQLGVPPLFWDWIASSWQQAEPSLYGRLDLAYDGRSPARLYELNYDTPTALFEAACFQWQWLQDQKQQQRLAADADQFNSIHETLIARFAELAPACSQPLYFSTLAGWTEDEDTVEYLRDCATQAGLRCASLPLQQLGISQDGRFTDQDDRIIRSLFKLYPLEDMLRDRFGACLPGSGLRLLEPPWKLLLSNKGILPLLWQHYPGHPNLLEAYFDPDGRAPAAGWVRKPLYSREGANIWIHAADGSEYQHDGPYGGPWIVQRHYPLPQFGGGFPVLGSWLVGDRACGLGIREDAQPITGNLARFVPHAIID